MVGLGELAGKKVSVPDVIGVLLKCGFEDVTERVRPTDLKKGDL